MKNIWIVCASLVLGSNYAFATNYDLVCHGATGIRLTSLWQDPNGTIVKSGGQFYLAIYYNRGTSGANTSTPPLGTCTWRDRGVNADEPNCVAVKASDFDLGWYGSKPSTSSASSNYNVGAMGYTFSANGTRTFLVGGKRALGRCFEAQ